MNSKISDNVSELSKYSGNGQYDKNPVNYYHRVRMRGIVNTCKESDTFKQTGEYDNSNDDKVETVKKLDKFFQGNPIKIHGFPDIEIVGVEGKNMDGEATGKHVNFYVRKKGETSLQKFGFYFGNDDFRISKNSFNILMTPKSPKWANHNNRVEEKFVAKPKKDYEERSKGGYVVECGSYDSCDCKDNKIYDYILTNLIVGLQARKIIDNPRDIMTNRLWFNIKHCCVDQIKERDKWLNDHKEENEFKYHQPKNENKYELQAQQQKMQSVIQENDKLKQENAKLIQMVKQYLQQIQQLQQQVKQLQIQNQLSYNNNINYKTNYNNHNNNRGYNKNQFD